MDDLYGRGLRKRAEGRPQFFEDLAEALIQCPDISAKLRDELQALGRKLAGAKVLRRFDRTLAQGRQKMEEEKRASGTQPTPATTEEEEERDRIIEGMVCSRKLRVFVCSFSGSNLFSNVTD